MLYFREQNVEKVLIYRYNFGMANISNQTDHPPTTTVIYVDEFIKDYPKLVEIVNGLASTYFVLQVLFLIPTVLGNLFILISLTRFRRLRSRMHVLIGNLALADLLVGTTVLPVDIFISINRRQVASDVCMVRSFFMTTSVMASVLNMTIISLERYIAIVHPLHYRHSLTKFRLCLISLGAWALAVMLGLLPILGWNNWRDGMLCMDELVYASSYSGLCTLIILTSIFSNFFMYITVMKIAWNQLHNRGDMIPIDNLGTSSDANSENSRQLARPTRNKHYSQNARQIRKTKLMAFVLGVFAICWGPYCIGVILEAFIFEKSIYSTIVINFLGAFAVLNSGLNWLVFGWKNPEFRKAFRMICMSKCCSRAPDHSSGIDLYESSTEPMHSSAHGEHQQEKQ